MTPWRQYGKNGEGAKRLRISFAIAFSLHGLLFLVGSVGLATQAQYGMAGAVPGGETSAVKSQAEETVDLEDFSDDAPSERQKRPVPAHTPLPDPGLATAHSGGALEVPSYYRNPPPPYPLEARRLKQEGSVLLAAGVDDQGRVTSVSLRQSSGSSLLDESALQTVKTWRFKPARLAGIAVSTKVDIPVRFKLTDDQP
jgi:protein TonB